MASEAEILQQLDLGRSKAIINNEPQNALGELLVSLCDDVIVKLKEKLDEYNVNTSSRNLSQSLKPTEITVEGSEVSVGISAEFYWRYINYGVNGTEIGHGAPKHPTPPPAEKSFFQAIKDWIPTRSIQLPPQFKDYDSFTFAVMNNIKKHGKEARPFFSDVVNDGISATLRKPIEAVLGEAIKINIVEPWQ